MAVTPTPITKMTFGWYMIYDTTMTGREKYPYVIAIRETLPWSGNSEKPRHEKDKAPFLTVVGFSYDRRKKVSRTLHRNPARSACTLKRLKGEACPNGPCLPMTQEHPKNAPDFSKNGNIFSLSVSRMGWRIYAAWHRASGFSYAARPLLRVRRVRALASSP